MPRTITESRTLYLYSELSDEAKDKARHWYAEASAGDESFSEHIIDDFVTIAAACGWSIPNHTQRWNCTDGRSGTTTRPAVTYEIGYCQGDGAGFSGTWSAHEVSVKALRAHAPKDPALLRIVRDFKRLARAERFATASTRGHRPDTYPIVDADPNRADASLPESQEEILDAAWPQWERDFKDATRDLCRWLYDTLVAEYEYQYRGDGLTDTMAANAYTFLSDGTRYEPQA